VDPAGQRRLINSHLKCGKERSSVIVGETQALHAPILTYVASYSTVDGKTLKIRSKNFLHRTLHNMNSRAYGVDPSGEKVGSSWQPQLIRNEVRESFAFYGS
jgi:hypothetical protein